MSKMSSHSVLTYLCSLKCEQLLLFFFILCIAFCRDPARQKKFYAKEKKKDGSKYEPDSLRPKGAQAYNRMDEDIFWIEGKLGNYNGVALTNSNFKNL